MIGEAHADVSSASAEIYALSNATQSVLALSYTCSELGVDFPTPFQMLLDNAAAQCFVERSGQKTALKHIDCRQEWVKTLRDKRIIVCEHVASELNLADLFTKILSRAVFESHRDRIMVQHPTAR